eukprot:38576-Pleurochrysis_carterae.AAC.2
MAEAWRKAGPNAPASATTPPPPNTSATYVNPAVLQPPIINASTADPKVGRWYIRSRPIHLQH